MKKLDIWVEIIAEVSRAEQRYPDWPCDPVHAAAIVVEEAGELIQAALDHCNPKLNHKSGSTTKRMMVESIQTAAMAVRFLEGLEYYEGVYVYENQECDDWG